MKNLRGLNNPYDDEKVIDACSLFGVINRTGERFSVKDVIKAITNMHDRGNGLGGGFSVYGIYPEHEDHYAFHIMYMSQKAKNETEAFIKNNFSLAYDEEVPTKDVARIIDPPIVWRYFVEVCEKEHKDRLQDDYVVERVMKINTRIEDAFVFSSGKNMGVFKGVGFPEDIAEYFRLKDYQGYLWTAHGRFPTNTQSWWGGAHPFNILDWTVIHNGELSSYGINRRYLEMYGYHCTMQTDSEAMAYALDLLMRKHQLPIEIVSKILAPPLWSHIDRMSSRERALHRALRQVYSSLLMNGPFTVIIAHQGEMIGLTDRIRLRPLTAGVKGDMLYLSSEEAAIRLICPNLERAWIPMGGEPIVGRLNGEKRC